MAQRANTKSRKGKEKERETELGRPAQATQRPVAPQDAKQATDKFERYDQDRLLAIYAIYESNWQHRDHWWEVLPFRWFITSLTVSLLPHLEGYFGVQINLNPLLFLLLGMALAIFFLVVSRAYGSRLRSAAETVKKIQEQLDEELRRIPLDKHQRAISSWMPWSMFAILLAVNAFSALNMVGTS